MTPGDIKCPSFAALKRHIHTSLYGNLIEHLHTAVKAVLVALIFAVRPLSLLFSFNSVHFFRRTIVIHITGT